MRLRFAATAFLFLSFLVWGQEVRDDVPSDLEGVGIEEKIGAPVVSDVKLVDQQGKEVTLDALLTSEKPTILSLVYYECPMLCTLTLNGLVDVLKLSKFSPHADYNLVSISIDPAETPELAREKRTSYLKQLAPDTWEKLNDTGVWPFLTGSEENVRKIANSIGFNYRYLEAEDEYAHAAAFFVISPEKKISRYFYGVAHEQKNLDLALVEAGDGKVGNTFDQFLLYCYRYDPDSKGYVLFAKRFMKISGALATFLIFGFLFFLFRKETRTEENIIEEENVA